MVRRALGGGFKISKPSRHFPVSALLQDEPSITFLNMLANDDCRYHQCMRPDCNLVDILGNHEFDEGVVEMSRLIVLMQGRPARCGCYAPPLPNTSFSMSSSLV